MAKKGDARRENVSEQMCVEIAQQQCDLKKHQARRPNRGGSPELWQNKTCNQWLDLKQQKRTQENCD